jgi:hypothetical protein
LYLKSFASIVWPSQEDRLSPRDALAKRSATVHSIAKTANNSSYTRVGLRWSYSTYANDTAVEDFLTRLQTLTVKEIEVFEIADETDIRADVEKCANGRLFQEMARNADERLSETAASRG